MSWNEVALVAVQFCTHLMTAGVLKKIEKHEEMDGKFQVQVNGFVTYKYVMVYFFKMHRIILVSLTCFRELV